MYVADECRCACPNGAEEDACLARSDLHEWSPDTCRCRCKEEAAASAECSTGMVFDVGECRCCFLKFVTRNCRQVLVKLLCRCRMRSGDTQLMSVLEEHGPNFLLG